MKRYQVSFDFDIFVRADTEQHAIRLAIEKVRAELSDNDVLFVAEVT